MDLNLVIKTQYFKLRWPIKNMNLSLVTVWTINSAKPLQTHRFHFSRFAFTTPYTTGIVNLLELNPTLFFLNQSNNKLTSFLIWWSMTVLSRLILRYRTASSVRSFCTKSSENDLTRAATAAALSSALSVKNSNGRGRNVQWVFLGCPGVGKGTYAARLSNLLGVPHISTGDLVRQELSSHGPLSSQVSLFLFPLEFV